MSLEPVLSSHRLEFVVLATTRRYGLCSALHTLQFLKLTHMQFLENRLKMFSLRSLILVAGLLCSLLFVAAEPEHELGDVVQANPGHYLNADGEKVFFYPLHHYVAC